MVGNLKAVNVAASKVVLPALNAPLTGIYDSLQSAAMQGDAMAACRLSYELNRCGRLEDFERAIANQEANMALLPNDSSSRATLTKMLDTLRETVEKDKPVCVGFAREKTLDAWKYALMAAQSGHIPSMMHFVRRHDIGLDLGAPVDVAEGWVAYKQYAPDLLQSAVDRGNPNAFEYAAFMHLRPGDNWRLMPFDPVKGVAYYMALQSVAADAYKPKLTADISYSIERHKLTAGQVVQAQEEAQLLSKKMAKLAKGSVDFSKGSGVFDGKFPQDGDHCAAR